MAADLFANAGVSTAMGGDGVDDLSIYVEQAEYLNPEIFQAYTIDHPREGEIIRKLVSGGAKLLVGPRGCGKTTLMLRAYYKMLADEQLATLPVYVNFKLSLKLEPLYQTTPNATFWFRTWLILKIYMALHEALQAAGFPSEASSLPAIDEVIRAILIIEAGDSTAFNSSIEYQVDELQETITGVLDDYGYSRCVLLLDDAAHAFSPKQQEDFFDFFRRVKSQKVAPKAAIYPGITNLSPSFHVGHDAEQVDVWIRPDTDEYVTFMRGIAEKRHGGKLPAAFNVDSDVIPFLAYCAFGIPRAFLNMIRSLESEASNSTVALDRRKVLDAAKQSRHDAHTVFESLAFKLPVYKNFIARGDEVYTKLIAFLKVFNGGRDITSQGVEIGIKRPAAPELVKLIGFYQYAGLLMPSGENSRGIKGVFDIYLLHFADLVTENAVVGLRTKSLNQFLTVFRSVKHQIWPRIASERLVSFHDTDAPFALALPACQVCGTERLSEDAKFCVSCGNRLKTASLYHTLVGQDISNLPITKNRANSIKRHSNLRTIKDLLLDNTRLALRSVPQIGPKWAERIARYAEEHVA